MHMALGAADTTAALRRLVQSAAIRRVAGTWIIPTTDKEHETLATYIGRLQIKQESRARIGLYIAFCVHVNVLFYHLGLCILPNYKVNVLLCIIIHNIDICVVCMRYYISPDKYPLLCARLV